MSKSPTLCKTTLHAFEQVRAWLDREAVTVEHPLIVGISGPGGSGKSTLTQWLLGQLKGVCELSLDEFRLPRSERKSTGRYGSHPEGNDLRLLTEALDQIGAGKPFRQPVFDRNSGQVMCMETRTPGRIVLADGEIAAHRHLRSRFDRLILVDAHWRTQLNTRLTRDLQERQCSLEKAIHIFLESNLRDYPEFAQGAEEEADVLLYRTARHRFSLRRIPDEN